MTYHFDCFDSEPSTPPHKGPSPQDPGPQKDPGSQGQPPKGNNQTTPPNMKHNTFITMND
ncbi:hypothetical protein C1646_750569 [Rhizophagus diaphanus]|nr:hypothetical protein C1646_750569 [Rhizophagus diaphanus] [Rhizophagus sp. MUCL 43196]